MTIEQIKIILKNYRVSFKKIGNINVELEKYRVQDQVKTSSCFDPYIETRLNISGYSYSPEVQFLLKQKVNCMQTVRVAKAFIETIDDLLVKNLCEAYYIQGAKKSWMSIAISYGWYDEQKPRLLLANYFRSITKKQDVYFSEYHSKEHKKAG